METESRQDARVGLLVCAATQGELQAFWTAGEPLENFIAQYGSIVCTVSGVGVPATFAQLWPLVQKHRPKRILNMGIAGAYPNSGLQVGDVVMAHSETFGDMGFELPTEPGFQPITDSPFGSFYSNPLPMTLMDDFLAEDWPVVTGRGCTVNSCTGTEQTGLLRERLYEAQFETMEGAVVALIGLLENIPVRQIRAISNIAARRDMRPENIGRALDSLHRYLSACQSRGNR